MGLFLELVAVCRLPCAHSGVCCRSFLALPFPFSIPDTYCGDRGSRPSSPPHPREAAWRLVVPFSRCDVTISGIRRMSISCTRCPRDRRPSPARFRTIPGSRNWKPAHHPTGRQRRAHDEALPEPCREPAAAAGCAIRFFLGADECVITKRFHESLRKQWPVASGQCRVTFTFIICFVVSAKCQRHRN